MNFSFAKTIIYGTLAQVQSAVQGGSDVNELDEYGYYPLLEAAIANKMDVAEYLLSAGAKVNVPDMTGRTALHWAVDNGNAALADLLLRHGANANAYTDSGQPALVKPILRDQGELKQLLFKHHADLDFAKDYINAKLLGHLFNLRGVVDIVDYKKRFIELSFEGFYLEFTLNVVCHSFYHFVMHYANRAFRRFQFYLRKIVDVVGNAAELVQYQQYSIDRSQYRDRIHYLLSKPIKLLPVAYEGHGISFIHSGDIWVRIDRGEYGRQHGCVNFYRIGNPSAVNENFLFNLLYVKHTKAFITKDIDTKLRLIPIAQMPIEAQSTGNCSWANVEAAIPALFFIMLQSKFHFDPSQGIFTKNRVASLQVYRAWLKWYKDREVKACIDAFHSASDARKASKASILGAILMQRCHFENFRTIHRVEQMLTILTEKKYSYILRSYLDAYCEPKLTPAGRNLREVLESHGIDPDLV
jgi:hypothetical protein